MPSLRQSSEFRRSWPHVVKVAEIHKNQVKYEVADWLWEKSNQLEIDYFSLYTYLSNGEFGFKDPKIAMEFKLVWG